MRFNRNCSCERNHGAWLIGRPEWSPPNPGMKMPRLLTAAIVLGWFVADVALLLAYLPRLFTAAQACAAAHHDCVTTIGYAALLVLSQLGMVGALFVRNAGVLEAICERE